MSKGYKHFNGSRWVGGTAGLLHKVKQDGGLAAFKKKLVHDYVDKLIDDGVIEVVQPQLQVIDGGKSCG